MASPIPIPTTAIHAATKSSLEPALVVDPTNSALAIRRKPAATASLVPTTRTIRTAKTAPRTTPAISGNSLNPEPIASVPSTPWKYWGIVNNTPIMDRIATDARIAPQVNEAERKSVRSTRG
jgi:hypothetical protein